MTLILKINSRHPEGSKISRASEIILKGGTVVFPTETVYGIGANAFDKTACRNIFRTKQRNPDNPLIVHVSSMEMADKVAHIPSKYRQIIKRIWPAPFTIVVKAKKSVPKVVTAGLDTVCVRMPQNKIALSLIDAAGVPIAAPSANISRFPSSTRPSHVKAHFRGKVDAIIESKPSRFGIESTILDLERFVLLRPGAFTVSQIEHAFGRKVIVTNESRGLLDHTASLSPGTKHMHYSPSTPLFLFNGNAASLKSIMSDFKGKFVFIGSSESCRLVSETAAKAINLGKNRDMRKIASNLFHALIVLDSIRPEFAIVESFPEKGLGLAVMNRLRKACRHRYFDNKAKLARLVQDNTLRLRAVQTYNDNK